MRLICAGHLMSNMETNDTPENGGMDMQQPDMATPTVSPGKQLARRREELNLTVEQVAGQLNLAPRQVEAIEADNFHALPGMAIARGFVRSYARLVRLDAEPLLATMAPAVTPPLDTRGPKQTYVASPLKGDRLSFSQRENKRSKTPVIVFILIALVVAAIAAQQFGLFAMLPDADRVEVPQNDVRQPAPAMQQNGRAVEVLPAPEIAPESMLEPVQPAPAEPVVVPTKPQNTSSVPPVALSVKADDAKVKALDTADSKDALVLRIREKSWIEVKRADGAVIAARVFDAGAVESFPLKGELALVIGNATGVDASLRGEPLDLQAKARANVARLNLK